jgi:hypothetical protein
MNIQENPNKTIDAAQPSGYSLASKNRLSAGASLRAFCVFSQKRTDTFVLAKTSVKMYLTTDVRTCYTVEEIRETVRLPWTSRLPRVHCLDSIESKSERASTTLPSQITALRRT